LAALRGARGRNTARRFRTESERHETKPRTTVVNDLIYPYPGQSRTIRDDD
jgi:hypothetical protein